MCPLWERAEDTIKNINKSFDKTKSARELENEELKSAIKRIYKENKGVYGAPRIHYILGIEGFNVSLKRVQRLMTKLNLCAVTVKKYKPHSSKKVVEDLENVLKRDFTTTYINEKWVGDITSSINYMTPEQCELLARSAA